MEDVKKRKDKLEVEFLEVRVLFVFVMRIVDRLERYDGEGVFEDEEEGIFEFVCYIEGIFGCLCSNVCFFS